MIPNVFPGVVFLIYAAIADLFAVLQGSFYYKTGTGAFNKFFILPCAKTDPAAAPIIGKPGKKFTSVIP